MAQSVIYFLLILNSIAVNATLQSVNKQFTDNEISNLLKPILHLLILNISYQKHHYQQKIIY